MAKPNEITSDPFEQRELVSDDYWEDQRWEEVRRLRDTEIPDNMTKANGLVSQINYDWGVD